MSKFFNLYELKKFEKILKIKFKNINILRVALTHSSYVSEKFDENLMNNERLEFLGDSVLQIVVSDYLFNKFKDSNEGILSKFRARIVSRETCAFFAKKLKLGEFLFLGVGEEKTGGRTRISNLSNAFEAILGAIYIDSGLEKVFNFLLPFLEHIKEYKSFHDYKTELQEKIQKKYKKNPYYRVIEEKGASHDKQFIVDVLFDGKIIGKGLGNTKKIAEQCAAKNALNK